MGSPIYFTLVRLDSGDLASLTIIREPTEFFVQLRSYGFTEHTGAASWLLAEMGTGAFLDVVSTVCSIFLDRPFTYIIPDGVTRADWLMEMEVKARDPRFSLKERDGEFAYCMTVPVRK
ncbi:hypothetical protein [Rhizobium leguminosarum]|jgi:hypothetical protein|uniref:hypothetical protein n=1 Tax=Rhizobium leguminosarum TaxID=384 RepID=UPI001C9805D1|nr:hypothetical protein [Rhizobium leguminosarum]MBY5826324.1 hypothetical protein [Rhizobium leguminosarum]